MSLWTPSGEHPVDRPGPGGGSPTAPGSPGGAAAGGPGGTPAGPAPGSPGGRPPGAAPTGSGEPTPAAEADMEALRRQLAEAPAEVVVANHCYGLFELAAVYLSQSPPLLAQAQLAIDALGCLVDGLGERLGEPRASLQEALAQVRLAFVQLGSAEQVHQPTDGGSSTGNGAAAPGIPAGEA